MSELINLGGLALSVEEVELLCRSMTPRPFKRSHPWPGKPDAPGFQWEGEVGLIHGIYSFAPDSAIEIEVLVAVEGQLSHPADTPLRFRLPVSGEKLPQYRAVGASIRRVIVEALQRHQTPAKAAIPRRTSIYIGERLSEYLSMSDSTESLSGRLEALAGRYLALIERSRPTLTEMEMALIVKAYRKAPPRAVAAEEGTWARDLAENIQRQGLADEAGDGLLQRLRALDFSEQLALAEHIERELLEER